MHLLKRYILFVFVLLYALSLYAQKSKLVFATHWLPQAQFAGYYVAKDKGFYADAGIDVEIIHPSASVNALEYLSEGHADIISLFLITALDARLKGIDLINIAQFSQHSAIVLVSKKTSGIETLDDFNGKTIGIWMSGFQEVPRAFVNNYNLNVEWIPILSTVNLFLIGGIDIMTVMWYNEYNQIYLSGINRDELNCFFMSDYGYNVPEDGLYTLRQTSEIKRKDLKAFVAASKKGWEYASENREYTVNLVVDLMCKANIPSNIFHQSWMLDKVLETQSIEGKNVKETELLRKDFEHALTIIEDINDSEYPFVYDDFFQPVLLQETNKTNTP